MKEFYELNVAGLKRNLPLCRLTDELKIGAFVIFGDVELTECCARDLLKKIPCEYDVMITAESKGIPLIHEMAKQSGNNTYVLARKVPKLYMKDCIGVEVNSITTEKKQTLYLDHTDIDKMNCKRVLVVDDVISTGESLEALVQPVEQSGGTVLAKMAILAEGDAAKRDDIIFLEPLPLFDNEGNAI